MNDIHDINKSKYIKINNVKSLSNWQSKFLRNFHNKKNLSKINLKKILSLNDSKYNTNDTIENVIQRFDAKGVPLIKGNSKNYHVYFIDEISNNKLAQVENIQSYKKYNAENLSKKNSFNKEIDNENHSSCCCLIF